MKIVIELNDADLHTAVRQEVDKAIARITTDHIERRVGEILLKKFERISDADVQVAIREMADRHIKQATGVYGQSLQSILRDAALTVARDALRRA